MGVLVYTTRAAGIWLLGRIPLTAQLETWLNSLPGIIIIALAAPIALATGKAETAATVVTALIAARTGNMFASLLGGVVTVAIFRRIF